MFTKVIISQSQQVTSGDLNRMGDYPEAAIDSLVYDAVEPGLKFTGFSVVTDGDSRVRVGAGLFYAAGKVYQRNDDGGVSLDLISHLPSVVNRIVSIVTYGTETDSGTEPRTFLQDAVTRVTQARSTSTDHIRYANLDSVAGDPGTNPQTPALNSNMIAVAYVMLSPTGILSILPASENVLGSVKKNADAIAELNVWRKLTGARIDTIQTDVTGLSARLDGTARVEQLAEVQQDLAVLKQKEGLPDSYSSYGFDPLLALEQSDTDDISVTGTATNPLIICEVREGIRFAAVQAQLAQMELLNLNDATVSRTDNMIMPTFAEVVRIASVGRDDEISLSQYENQTVDYTQKQISSQHISYGPSFTVCSNSAFWQSGQYDPITGIFTKDGQTFQAAVDIDTTLATQETNGISNTHLYVRLEQFWSTTSTDSYWNANVTTSSINGSMIGETFLNSQEGIMTAIGLYFTRVGTASVTLLLCETTADNSPNVKAVIAKTTLNPGDIKIWPAETKVPFSPTLLKRGQRYAIVPVTTGAHYLALTVDNKYAQGSLFTSTDSAWFAGDLTKDIAFTVYVAQFSTPRLEVQLNPVTLAGGIVGIDIITDMVLPSGCSITYAAKINNIWTPLQPSAANLLAGLHELLQFKAILTGTTDLMPRLGLAGRSQVKTTRPRTDYTHVSTAFAPPTPVKTVTVKVRLESVDLAHHTAAGKLLSGAGYGTQTSPAVTTDSPPDDGTSGVIIRKFTYTFGAAITSFKILLSGTTDSAQNVYHVASRQFVSFPT